MAWLEGGSPVYRALWAHDAAAERKSFDEVMDLLAERRRAHPEMHIYHYGALDRSALKVMSNRYGSREREIDQLLREDAFVDLLTVVRQALRISHPSYGLKKVETFYFNREEEGVFEAGGPILAYEEWLETSDPAMLQTIENYNREDCLSTIELRTWLLKLRDEAKGQFGTELHWRIPPELKPRKEEALEAEARANALSAALLSCHPEHTLSAVTLSAAKRSEGPSDSPDNVISIGAECRARWLLAHLLHYHRREARPGLPRRRHRTTLRHRVSSAAEIRRRLGSAFRDHPVGGTRFPWPPCYRNPRPRIVAIPLRISSICCGDNLHTRLSSSSRSSVTT